MRTKQAVHVWISRVAIALIGATYSQADAQSYTFTTLAGTENVGGVGLAIDKGENIYVAGYSNHVIVKVTPTGQATTIAGVFGEPGNNDGPALSARFREPGGVALDSAGNIYVADQGNHAVRRISRDGIVTTVAVFPDIAMPPNGVIFPSYPQGIAVDPAGNVFVTDSGHYVVRKVTPSGESTIYAGSPVITTGGVDGLGTAARFLTPKGCFLDSTGNLYVADLGNYAIRKISPSREVTTVAGHLSTSAGDGYFPSFHRGYVDGTATEARMDAPQGVACDSHGFVFVADGTRIRRISPNGYVTTIAGGEHRYLPHGNMLPPYFADGTGSDALFAFLTDIAIGPSGAIYVLNGGIKKGVPSRDTPASQLVNFSVRGRVDADAGGLIVGFVTSDIFAKRMVIRGIGPSLGSFGIHDSVSDLELRLYGRDGVQISANTKWAGHPSLSEAFARVGAFPLPANSADTSLTEVIPGALHTVQLAAANGQGGAALAEIYDDDPDMPTTRLVNVSARARVNATQDLAAGFVIRGTEAKTILVRAIGPTLAQFGVPNALQEPAVTVFNSAGSAVGANTRWQGNANLVAAFTRVGAFPLAPDSGDSALLVVLPSGAYTAEVRGADGSSGTALIEVFEVPEAKSTGPL
jgi:sugar lactone lactonase YvrE